MNPIYTPILNAKQGEFDACENLPDNTKNLILPLFEVPVFTDQIKKQVAYRDSSTPKLKFVNDRMKKLVHSFGTNTIMLDIFHWAQNSVLENGENVLSVAYNVLKSCGCEAIPVIGYDRWEDVDYFKTLEILCAESNNVSLRLEAYAFEDMLDEDYFLDQIDEIIESLQITPENCNVILDFNDVTETSIITIQEKAERAIHLLTGYNFRFFSIVGCSISQMVNEMVSEIDSSGTIHRRELLAWKALRKSLPKVKLVLGDYGVVNPNVPEGIIAPHANGKIRYTIQERYFIARGHSRQKGNKGEQMYDLAKMVVNSGYYMGDSFSWGDNKIDMCRLKKIKGGLPQWVAYDTNHHIAYAVAEVQEFERTLVPFHSLSTKELINR